MNQISGSIVGWFCSFKRYITTTFTIYQSFLSNHLGKLLSVYCAVLNLKIIFSGFHPPRQIYLRWLYQWSCFMFEMWMLVQALNYSFWKQNFIAKKKKSEYFDDLQMSPNHRWWKFNQKTCHIRGWNRSIKIKQSAGPKTKWNKIIITTLAKWNSESFYIIFPDGYPSSYYFFIPVGR